MKIKSLPYIIALFSVFGLAGFFWVYQSSQAEENIQTEIQQSEKATYQAILVSGVAPALSPDYAFPTNFQYLNGCFGFAVGHILQDRGHEDIDFSEMEERVKPDRTTLWGKEEREKLAQEYDLKFKWSKNPKKLFKLLSQGEAVILRYEYPLDHDGEDWVLHAVAAYSFDDEGIWTSETMSGKRKVIPYEKLFNETGDEMLYHFGRVVEL